MNSTTYDLDENERRAILNLVNEIVHKEASEEMDLIDTIADEYFQNPISTVQDHPVKGQLFSFGSPEMMAYLTPALLFVTSYIVIPYLKKVLEKTIEKASEESVDGLARKIRGLLDKRKKEGKPSSNVPPIDLVIPINWVELERKIKSDSQQAGFSRKRANQLAKMTVQELSENQIVFGEIALSVLRVPLNENDDKPQG